MQLSNVPALSQKKYTCDLRSLLREESQIDMDRLAYASTDQYDAFIFKDGFTQSSYTFNKLKSPKGKGACKPQRQGHQIMNILGNIKKYRNLEILRRVKEKEARSKEKVLQLNRERGMKKKMQLSTRRSEFDDVSRTFFRQYLYQGSHFCQKQKTEDRLRRIPLHSATEMSSSESSIDEPFQQQALKVKMQRREQLDNYYEQEFTTKYADECKQIQSDLKIKFGQIPRHLVQPQNKSQIAMSVRACVRRHQKMSSQASTFTSSSANTRKESGDLVDLPTDSGEQTTFTLQNSWFLSNSISPSQATDKQTTYFLDCIRQSRSIEVDTQLKSKPKLIRCRDNKGNNPLHFAAKTSDVETVDMLVKKGCDPFAQNYFGKQPIDIARHFDNEEVVNYLRKLLLR